MRWIIGLLLLLLIAPLVLCEPLYAFSSTRDFKLCLIYNEAIIDKEYSIIMDFTALVNMTINVLMLSIWSVKELSYTLLKEIMIVKNTTVPISWSIRKTITIIVPDSNALLIGLIVNYTINTQKLFNYEVLVAVRERSYDELIKEIEELKLKIENLTSQLYELEIKLNRAKLNLSRITGNYSELKRVYEELRDEHMSLLKSYENKTIKLERLKASHEELVKDYNELSKKYNNLKARCNEVYRNYLSFKSRYEELSKRYDGLVNKYNVLTQERILLSNTTVALTVVIITILIYMNKEKLRKLIKLS